MKLKVWVAAAASAAVLLASAAQAQDKKVRVQMGGAFPSTTAILGTAELRLVKMMRDSSGGSIDAKFFEPGALVPAGQYFDAIVATAPSTGACGVVGLLHRQGHRVRHVRGRPVRS